MRGIAWDTEAWRSRFFAIWAGQAVSLLGSELVQFALVWWLTRTTGSAVVLAGATLFALLPQILVSPFAGALTDRWDRRRVMVFADASIAVSTLVLACLFALGAAQVWHVYVALLVRSAGSAFHWPAMQSSTSMMVPQRHLTRIGGLNQFLFGAAAVLCPPLGALLLESLPMHAVLAIDISTALLAISPLLVLRIPVPLRNTTPTTVRSVIADLGAGLRFVVGWRPILVIILTAMVVNLVMNPAAALTPLLVTQHFGGGAIELAGLQSARGFGMLGGGALLALWGGFRKRIVTVILALALLGAGFVAIGLLPPTAFRLALGAFAVTGVMATTCDGALFAILQSTVPHEMQGRVLSLLLSGAKAASPIGLAAAGPIADRFGVPVWYAIAGSVMVVASALIFLIPSVLQVEERPKA
ncbi:MAG: MFS transporter [Candidatus Bipolaricaulota bacterium]